MQNYDIVIIGSGPGGVSAALHCSRSGKAVAVVEREALGGTYINMGAIPTKALLRNAEIALILRHYRQQLGIRTDHIDVDFALAVKRSRQVAKQLSANLQTLLKSHYITILPGTAFLLSKNIIQVQSQQGNKIEVKANDIIIATGASPKNVPGIETDAKQIITYREAVLQPTPPRRALIIGGGALGVEIASLWNAYGVDVTIVEMLPRLVPYEDEEISSALTSAFTRYGMRIFTESTIQKITKKTDEVEVLLSHNGRQIRITVDQVLEAVSFEHNSRSMGLEEIGICLNENRAIQTDERFESNIPHIWAVGDVNGKLMLAASAAAMGNICAQAICGETPSPLDYEMLPKATYCLPQIASFGMTENQAREREHTIKVSKMPLALNSKAVTLGEDGGFVKIISDARSGKILGAHLIGKDVSELLPELVFAQTYGHTVDDIQHCIHARPTLSAALPDTLSALPL